MQPESLIDVLGTTIYERAVSLYKKNSILDIQEEGNTIIAKVQGSGINIYRVTLKAKKHGYEGRCNCPYGDLCKHIGALLLYLEDTSFGFPRYSVNGMSIVLDDDCMKTKDVNLRYIVLRQNCKLYTRWDDKGSILF